MRGHPDGRAVDAGRQPEGTEWLGDGAAFEVGERLLHDADAVAHREKTLDLIGIENQDGHVRA